MIREDLVAEFTLPWPTLRRAVFRLGAYLRDRGIIESDDDVLFQLRQLAERRTWFALL